MAYPTALLGAYKGLTFDAKRNKYRVQVSSYGEAWMWNGKKKPWFGTFRQAKAAWNLSQQWQKDRKAAKKKTDEQTMHETRTPRRSNQAEVVLMWLLTGAAFTSSLRS